MKKLLLSLLLISGLAFAGGPVQVPGYGTVYSIATPITVQSLNVGTTTASIAGQIRTPGLLIGADGSITTVGTGTGSVAGNARGVGAVDTQVNRSAATMVAAGAYTGIFSGTNNTVGPLASRSAILSGDTNTISTGTCNIIGGGNANQITGGNYNGILSGQTNVISSTGTDNTIAGGIQGIISGGGSHSFIGGGCLSKITGDRGGVVAGISGTVGGQDSFVGAGYYCNADGTRSFVGGGETNAARVANSAVVGGKGNEAWGMASCVPGGTNASANSQNEISVGGVMFAAHGDSQWSNLIAGRLATDSVATRLTTDKTADNATNRWTIASGSCWVGTCNVSAVAADAARSTWGCQIVYRISRTNNVVSVSNVSYLPMPDPVNTALATSSFQLTNEGSTGSVAPMFTSGYNGNVRVTCTLIGNTEVIYP